MRRSKSLPGDAGRVRGSDARSRSTPGPGVEDGPSGSGPEPPGLHPTGASCQPVPVRRPSTRACRQLLKAGELLRPWAGRDQLRYGPSSTPAARQQRRPRLSCRLLLEAGVRASVPVGRTRAVGLRARALHPAARPERRRRLLVPPSRLPYISKLQSWRAPVARSTNLHRDLWGVGVHTIYDTKYFCKTEIPANGTGIYTSQRGYDSPKDKALGPVAKAGDIYSMGIRIMSGKFFLSVANEIAGDWMNMISNIKASDYKFKIWSREDVILSIHMSEGVENNYYRLPWHYDLPYSSQPPGSSIIALLECETPEEETKVSIDTEGNGPRSRDFVNYGKVPGLKKMETFFVYARNLPEGYTVATSFSPEPKMVAHKSAKNHIHLYRPENCSTLRLTQNVILGAES
ncbi:uncharacterized protein [Dermacentor andersoni]